MTTAVDYSIIKELLREKIDPISLLEYYGVDIADRSLRYNTIRACCPLHDSDNPSSFAFDLNTKIFTCFSRHCGESPDDWFHKDGKYASRDIFMFIKLIEEKRKREEGFRNFHCSFSRALEIASKITGIPINESTSSYNKDLLDNLDTQKWTRAVSRLNQNIELNILDESEIDVFQAMLPLCDYIHTRNFDEDILSFFQVGYSPEGIDEPYRLKSRDFPGRVTFPVRDKDGNLVGWSGRLATDDKDAIKKHNKWMHKLDFDKGMVLYNYNNAKSYIKESMELILVEGAWDCIRLWSYGIKNAVAVMGSSLTPEQLQLAISSAFKIKVFLDADGAGKSGTKRICEQLKNYVDVYLVESRADPDELNQDEAYQAIYSAKRYIGDGSGKMRK